MITIMAWIIFLVGLCAFYNCYWKRKNFPPGPMPWPIIGNIPSIKRLDGRPPYAKLMEWRKRYGNLFTIWIGEVPNICVADFDLMQDTFIRDADSYTGRLQLPEITKIFRGGIYGVVFTDGEVWRRQRRFTFSVLRDFGMGKNLMEEKIIQELGHIFKKFYTFAESRTPILIGRHFDICVGSIISSILFGFRYDDSRISDFDLIRNSIAEMMRLHSDPRVALLFWKANLFRHFPGFHSVFKQVVENRDRLFNYIDAQVDRHETETHGRDPDEEPADFIDAYLREINRETVSDGKPTYFTRDQLRNVVLDLLITGQDTTSLTLGFTLLYVLHNPHVQSRLHAELDGAAIDNAFILYSDRTKLPYLNAVINESQRLTNLLPENLLHETTRDVIIAGRHIPRGTVITPQISCVLYDEKIFPEPYTFRPERFLDEEGALRRVDALIPFSVGKRACIGENLARMELFLILANIFKRFTIKPIDETRLPSLEKIAGLTVHYQPYECLMERR